MADIVSFDPGTVRGAPDRTIEQLVLQLNRQGFLERSIVTPLRDRYEYGRDLMFFARSDTTTFETHVCPYNTTTTSLSTVSQAKDVLIAIPFVAGDSFSKNLIEAEVTTGGAAGSVFHLGIYNATSDLNGTPYPGSIVVQSIANVGTAAAVKSTAISTSLTYGRLYFLAYLCGVNAPTMRAVPTTNMRPALGFPATLGANPQYGYTVASTYAASGLPTSFPTGATAITTGAVPAIFLRSSGVQSSTRYVPAFSPTQSGFVLRRVKMWSQSGTSISTSSSYWTIDPSVRVSSSASSLGTFDTRTSKLAAGEVYYFGGPGELDLSIAADSILETKIVGVGWSDQSLADTTVQWDLAFAGGR